MARYDLLAVAPSGSPYAVVDPRFAYVLPDDEMAQGSTIGAPRCCIVVKRNNSVPGQFSDWLHGEILVNQGMMLSPWDAPRYLWAAIEGAGGLQVLEGTINPALAEDWRWLTAINVPYRGNFIAWIACRMPDGLHVHTTSQLKSDAKINTYASDITESARVADPLATVVAFASPERTLIFVGNSTERTFLTAASLSDLTFERFSVQVFSSVSNEWEDQGTLPRDAILDGIAVAADAGGFAMIEITPLVA